MPDLSSFGAKPSFQTKDVEFLDGTIHPVFFNEYVDIFRSRERDRHTSSKKEGYDSALFVKFRTVLLGMAMYNGLIDSADQFRKHYKVRLDKTLKEARKAEKDKIYPVLLLRFFGLRQINVRNCRLIKKTKYTAQPDGNIGFRGKNTLIIHFDGKETKNGKSIHCELNFEDSSRTHGRLTSGLYKYYKEVYPYVLENAAEPLEDEFFVSRKGRSSEFVKLPQNEGSFSNKFSFWVEKFLTFESVDAANYHPLNPHQLRRTCINWLNRSNWTDEEIANYVGDTPETVRNDYLKKDRVLDSTATVTEKNLILRNLEKELEKDKDIDLIKNFVKRADAQRSAQEKAQEEAHKRQIQEVENRCELYESQSAFWREQATLSQKREEKIREENITLQRIIAENSYQRGNKPIED
jgi:hypothetical protein